MRNMKGAVNMMQSLLTLARLTAEERTPGRQADHGRTRIFRLPGSRRQPRTAAGR
jgi:hypothetical protein